MEILLNGTVGFALVDAALVSALLAAIGYLMGLRLPELHPDRASWLRLGRISFQVHAASVFGILVVLMGLILTHQYQYHYVWSHSSRELPLQYVVACLWEGQEGSFLTWMVWHALLGLILLRVCPPTWRPGVLGILATVQFILATMILGVYLPGDIKVGSSPFLTLHEALPNDTALQSDPNFVPANGNGLNSLLQNYWMVIHPPTLFMGFALTLVPFAFAITALLRRDYSGWLKPATPWMLASALVLGVGILMGGYWAYETLNFGGYWNWDPVENASLVPWLTCVGSLHVALAYRHGKTNLRTGMVLVLATFLLVLYSTFLTRSGILGDASVHSFTDLGLSGQLLVLLLAYLLFTMALLAWRWKELPTRDAEQPFWSRETFLFLAALTLTFSATMISVVTSLPVFNKIFDTSLAPSGKIQLFYYKWNVWFGIAIGLLSAIGQFLYWNKIERVQLANALFRPFVAAALAASAAMLAMWFAGWPFAYAPVFKTGMQAGQEAGGIGGWLTVIGYAVLGVADELLLFAALFTVFANLDIMVQLMRRGNSRTTGGSLAHLGFGLMLLGILFSAGYEKTVSINLTPQDLGDQFDAESRRDNVLLVAHTPRYLSGYQVVYRGKLQAEAPISDLWEVSRGHDAIRIGFRDARNIRYGVDIPFAFFGMPGAQGIATSPVPSPNPLPGGEGLPPSLPGREGGKGPSAGGEGNPVIDMPKLKVFVENNLRLIQPQQLDGRHKYVLEFTPLDRELKTPDSTRTFVLYPEAEVNDRMGGLVLHPDRKVSLGSDLYTYVSSVPAGEVDSAKKQVRMREVRLAIGDTAQTSRAVIRLDSIVNLPGSKLVPNADATLRARLSVQANGLAYNAQPFFAAKGQEAFHFDASVDALQTNFRFEGIEQRAGQFRFVFLVAEEIQPDDFITIKALDKPLIIILWLGTFVMSAGFVVAIVRRLREQRTPAPAPAFGKPVVERVSP